METINRNYPIRVDQAEWLREQSHAQRRPAAELVREALDLYRTQQEPRPGTAAQRLIDRFRTGEGIDLDILLDGDRRIYGLDP